MDLKQIIENTKNVYMTNNSLNTLLDFERVLDEMNIYTYKNWMQGELIEGPVFEKYFVGAKFMWTHNEMPDPIIIERLKPYGIEVNFSKDQLIYPIKIESHDDYRGDGSRKGKLGKKPIWIVEIIIPKKLMQDIETNSIQDSDFDTDAVTTAYEQGLDDPKNTGPENE